MTKQIRTIGFRNALYVGQIDQSSKLEIAQGIGLVIDDMFLACMTNWFTQSIEAAPKPEGPTLLLYPNRQIFYSQNYPTHNKLQKFWCYITSQFKIYGNGQDNRLAIQHCNGCIISSIKIKSNSQLQYNQDVTYKSEQDKWRIIEQIISYKINPHNRKVDSFIYTNFIQKINNKQKQNHQRFISKNKRNQSFYALVNADEGLGFTLTNQSNKLQVQSIGYYKQLQKIKQMEFGRKYKDQVNSSTYKIQQGNFHIQQVYKFLFSQNRPAQSYKTSRKYFRQATTFSNKFLQFSQADEIYKKLKFICKQYVNKIGSKYGQKIIEGDRQSKQPNQQIDILAEQNTRRSHKYNDSTSQKILNREYNLAQAKAKIEAQVSKKKTGSGFTNTGTFKNRLETIQKTNSQSRRSRQKQYANLYRNTDRESKKTFIDKQRQRSPYSSSKKYNYIQYQGMQTQIPLRKQTKITNSYYEYPQNLSQPARLNHNYNYSINPNPSTGNPYNKVQQYPVKQFTLYPIPVVVQNDFMRYANQHQQKNSQSKRQKLFERERDKERERLLNKAEYEYQLKIQKQKQAKLLRDMEKQNGRLKDRFESDRLLSYRKNLSGPYQYDVMHDAINQPLIYSQPAYSGPYSHTHSYNVGSTFPTRKYFANFNYTDEKQKVGVATQKQRQKQVSPFSSRKPAQTNTKFSPIKKLFPQANQAKQKQKQRQRQKQRSKSPLVNRTVGKKIYSYVQ